MEWSLHELSKVLLLYDVIQVEVLFELWPLITKAFKIFEKVDFISMSYFLFDQSICLAFAASKSMMLKSSYLDFYAKNSNTEIYQYSFD